jgi:hypothetical protein
MREGAMILKLVEDARIQALADCEGANGRANAAMREAAVARYTEKSLYSLTKMLGDLPLDARKPAVERAIELYKNSNTTESNQLIETLGNILAELEPTPTNQVPESTTISSGYDDEGGGYKTGHQIPNEYDGIDG